MRRVAKPAFLLSLCAAGVGVWGCAELPGRAGLERLLEDRSGVEPYAVTRFAREPQENERPLSELERTLAYWSERAGDGRPRYEGVLVPEPPELYERVLERIRRDAERITLVAFRYDVVGYDDITLVEYREGEELLGFDYQPYEEAGTGEPGPTPRLLVGYANFEWWEYPLMLLDLPVYLAIGLKEFAGEVVKSPFEALSSGWIGPLAEGRSPFSPVSFERAGRAFVEDWRNGFQALTWRFRVRSRHTPLDLLSDLAGALPVAGVFLGPRSPPRDDAPLAATSIVAVSQGIHVGAAEEQFVAPLARGVEAARPEVVVVRAPYEYGGIFDVAWSLLNLSNGCGYDLASRLVFDHGVRPGDSVELVGFSGGVQRSLAAARALRQGKITVRRIVGVAGPAGGPSCALETTVLHESCGEDPVTCSLEAYAILSVLFPPDARLEYVPGAGKHHLPYAPDGKTRAPQLGYARRIEALLTP